MCPRLLVILLVVIFIVFPPCAPAAPGQEAAQRPDVTGTPSTKPPENNNHAAEPYEFDLIQTKVSFDADGKGYRDLEARVRIKSESAVREFGLLIYPYASSFESLEVIYARVRKPDGSVVETPASDIQELDSAVSREAPMYTDQREKHVAIKSLSTGDMLEIHLRWTIHDPVAPGHFWFDHNFFRDGVCFRETLEINVPRNIPVNLHDPDREPSIREDGARRIYTFENVNLKKREDSKVPLWEKNYKGVPPPDVQVSSFSAWKDVGDWFGTLATPKAAVTSEIRAKAEELTKGKATDEEKIRALYDFVSTRFRYIGIDLGLSRYTPHSAPEVLANRYGDCKDKHTLLAALLQAVDVAAYPVLISSSHRIDPSFPSPSLFDHVITAIPRGESFLFLDTTPEIAPFGLLIQPLRDHEALAVLPAQGTRLIATPANPPFSNYEIFHIDSSIDKQGTLDAKMKMEERGDGELALRLAYRATPQNNWQELTQRLVGGMGFAGTVSEVSVEQPEDTTQPFWLSFSYRRTDLPDWKDHRIVFPAPPIFIRELTEEQKLSKDPLPLGSPQEVTYETTVRFPEGFSPVVPQKVERKYDFAEFSAAYSLKEDTLHGTLHFKTKLSEIPGADRSKFTGLAKIIEDTERSYIFLKGNFPNTSVIGGVIPPAIFSGNSSAFIPQLERALENDPDNDAILLRLSSMYCEAGRASDAVALLKKAMDTHAGDVPEHLHVALGKAYLKIPDAKKAMSEFKEGLSSDAEPEEFNDAAYSLAEANVYLSEALDYSTRAVSEITSKTQKISLEDAEQGDLRLMTELAANWDTLGWIEFQKGDAPSAEKHLLAAWQLMQTSLIGEHLVEAYEKLGNKTKAAAICNMASSALFPNTLGELREKLSDEMGRLKPFLSRSQNGSYVDGHFALSDMRLFHVPYYPKLSGNSASAEFAILLTNGPTVKDVRFLSGAEELRGAEKALRSLKYPHSFPDENTARIIRKGTLTCNVYAKGCIIVLMPSTEAAAIPGPGFVTQ